MAFSTIRRLTPTQYLLVRRADVAQKSTCLLRTCSKKYTWIPVWVAVSQWNCRRYKHGRIMVGNCLQSRENPYQVKFPLEIVNCWRYFIILLDKFYWFSIFCHQVLMSEIIRFRKFIVWRHNDLKIPDPSLKNHPIANIFIEMPLLEIRLILIFLLRRGKFGNLL